MSRLGTILALSQSAWQECALLGHREIDVEHVLLATMDDEDVAAVLRRHGVTREGTRRQVEAVVRSQLASLGVDLGKAALTRRRPVTDLHHEAVGDLGTSRAAQELLAKGRSVPGVLLATLDLQDTTATQLLARQGADVSAVRREMDAIVARRRLGSRQGDTVEVASLPDTHLLDGAPGIHRRRSRFYAVPWERVWEQVSTADGARAWLLSDTTTQVTGPGELGGEIPASRLRTRPRGTYRRRLLAAEAPGDSACGHALWQDHWAWSRSRPWRRGQAGPGQWTHVTVTPADGGTRVDLVMGTVVYGRSQKLLSSVIRIAQAVGSRNALYQLGVTLEGAGGAAQED